MKRYYYLLILCFLIRIPSAFPQDIYVDPLNGNDSNGGSSQQPFQTIKIALSYANALTGTGEITIKLLSGIHLIKGRLDINPVRKMSDSTRFIIEAVVMPDDTDWTQDKMPTIQSISGNNSETQFPHATAFLVSSEHVTIRGIRFLGNPNPLVSYYYPISKEDQHLKDLEISQCYFIGNKESAPIQGGVWAHGPDNKVIHCIFYQCRNAVLFFNNVGGFDIRNTIVYGAYESAFWFGPEDCDFTFTNNVVANNNNFIAGPRNLDYSSSFSDSVISDNLGYVGYWSRDEQTIKPISKPKVIEKNIIKSGRVVLEQNYDVHLPKNHLHLTDGSTGGDMNVGIFVKGKL